MTYLLVAAPSLLTFMRQARFSNLVAASGKPEPYTLWQDPEKDRALQRAIKQDRILTVLQEPAATKPDQGFVGFLQKENAIYLLFPRSIKRFRARKIIGLKYDAIATPKIKGAKARVRTPSAAKKPSKPTARFRVTLTVRSEVKVEREVEAPNSRAARQAALANVDMATLDFPSGLTQTRVTKTTRLT